MEKQLQSVYKISGMTCQGCAGTVKKALAAIEGVEEVSVDLAAASALIISSKFIGSAEVAAALDSYPAYQLAGAKSTENNFWFDRKIWNRSGFNTLNCLIGCSIGDFGMILYLQAFHPGTSMAIQMILATITGLITSVMLETVLLHVREKFSWKLSLQTAFSMSFLSMVAMELAMNTTDFMITGGKAAFSNPSYWFALLAAMVAGFLVPWPYNYYKLKKFNKACH